MLSFRSSGARSSALLARGGPIRAGWNNAVDASVQARESASSLLLAGEFAPYDPVRFHLDGDDFECPSGVATPLALIFHELTTNAAKYGALSAPHGQIGLTWLEHDDQVEFDWVESGGPQPMAPQREGFGSALLRKGLRQFDGAVEVRFVPTGLHCKLSLSLPRPRQAETVDLETDRPPSATVSAPLARTAAAEPQLVLLQPRAAGRK